MTADVKEQYSLLLFAFDVPSIHHSLYPLSYCVLGGTAASLALKISAAILEGVKRRQWEELVAELDGREWLVSGTGESVAQAEDDEAGSLARSSAVAP